jgi:hypothetical protein
MIIDLIMSGQRDNYLLLSELFKNLTPEEIWDEFISIAKYLKDYYLSTDIETDYFMRFDICLFEVFTPCDGIVYRIGNPKNTGDSDCIQITANSIELYSDLYCTFWNASDEFKNNIIKFLSKI